MTGPRSATVQPHRTRARRLLPFLTAIILSPMACTEQSTEPQLPGAGQTPALTRMHPSLASKRGQVAPAGQSSMQMSLSQVDGESGGSKSGVGRRPEGAHPVGRRRAVDERSGEQHRQRRLPRGRGSRPGIQLVRDQSVPRRI